MQLGTGYARMTKRLFAAIATALGATTMLAAPAAATDMVAPSNGGLLRQALDDIRDYSLIDVRLAPEPAWHYEVLLKVEYTYLRSRETPDVRADILAPADALETRQGTWGTSDAGPYPAVEEQFQGPLVKGTRRIKVSLRLLQEPVQTRTVEIALVEPDGTVFHREAFGFRFEWTTPAGANLASAR